MELELKAGNQKRNVVQRNTATEGSEPVNCVDATCARILMKLKGYPSAMLFYDRSISSNISDLKLSKEREDCRALLMKTKQQTVDDNSQSISVAHMQADIISYAKRTALLIYQQQQKKCELVNDDLHKEQEVLIQAYFLHFGRGTTENLPQAFKLFLKASQGKTTKAEANFHVAKMLYDGRGTAKNVEGAILKFMETALLSPDNPHDFFNNQRNVGVAESRQFLGRYFGRTVVVEGLGQKTFHSSFASMWYAMGHESGHALSSHTLAGMYWRAVGVPQSDLIAESYWKTAIANGNSWSYVELANLYINQMEYAKAKSLIRRGVEICDEKDISFLRRLWNSIKSKPCISRTKEEIECFEDSYQLLSEGLCFRQRLKRIENVVQFTRMVQELKDALSGRDVYVGTGNDVKETDPSFILLEDVHFENFCWNEIQGSKYSRELVGMLIQYGRVMQNLEHYSENISTLTKEYKIAAEFIFLLRDFLKLKPFVVKWKTEHLSRLYSLLLEILNSNICKNSAGVPSLRKALAVCLAEIGIEQDPQDMGFQFLVRAWTWYPEEVQLSVTYSAHFVANQEYGKAYMVGAEALERFPKHVNLLYSHAQVCLHQHISNIVTTQTALQFQQEGLKCLSTFLSLASKEHPKVPEAFYTLGKVYYGIYSQLKEIGHDLSILIVNHFLNLGEIAERNQSTCFIPYRSLVKDWLYNTKESLEKQKGIIVSKNPLEGYNNNYY